MAGPFVVFTRGHRSEERNQPMAEMLAGLMQDDFPLNLHHVRRRMRDCHPAAEVLTLTPAGTERASFAEICYPR